MKVIPIQNSSWKVSYGGKPAYRTFRKIQNSKF